MTVREIEPNWVRIEQLEGLVLDGAMLLECQSAEPAVMEWLGRVREMLTGDPCSRRGNDIC